MSSNEARIPMPQIEQPADFFTEQKAKLIAAFHEAKRHAAKWQASYTLQIQGAKPLIQRVPPVLIAMMQDLKKYFEPMRVALGPLHHGNPKFEQSEHDKRKLAALFADENDNTVEYLFNKIEAEIKDLRNCYNPEDIQDYDDDKLAWMFFVDGCAVLFSIRYGLRSDFQKMNTEPEFLVFLFHDMFVLENQLPYRVLQILIGCTLDPERWKESITTFIADNLMTTIGYEEQIIMQVETEEKDYAHLLERFRMSLLVGDTEKSENSMLGNLLLSCGGSRTHRKAFSSIMELKEAWIYVQPNKTNNSLRNVSFNCKFLGRLRMPRIKVAWSTTSKFLNLVAFENCRDFENDFEVTAYLGFLCCLIKTTDDVKELRVTGVLHNYLGSDEEVANLFNEISRELVVADQGIYDDVREDVLRYSNNPLLTAMVGAYNNYYKSPWTIPAILGLFLSAIQTYYSLPHSKHK